jgi:hypothetical protein
MKSAAGKIIDVEAAIPLPVYNYHKNRAMEHGAGDVERQSATAAIIEEIIADILPIWTPNEDQS